MFIATIATILQSIASNAIAITGAAPPFSYSKEIATRAEKNKGSNMHGGS